MQGAPEQTVTLSHAYSSRRNSLNALRLILAFLVIVSHAPLIAGTGPAYKWADLDIGGWAVAGFFAISGWLITGSRLNMPLAPFMWRRCLRILPAFWAAIAVTAVVFAPIAWIADSNRPDLISAAGYVAKNAALWVFQPTIDGTLTGNATQTWNLSLWTLSWEMACYIGVGVLLGWAAARRDPKVMAAVFALALAGNAIVRITEIVPPSSAPGAGLRLGSFFLAGAMLRMYADKVLVDHRLAAASAVTLAVLWPFGLVGALGALPIAYLCLWAGIALPLSHIAQHNDISYGVYVYGYPVGQLLELTGAGELPAPAFIALTMLAVLPLSWASWLLVEKPTLRLKSLVRTPAPIRPAI